MLFLASCRKQDSATEAPAFGCDEAPLPTQAAQAVAPRAAPSRGDATETPAEANATLEASATPEGPALPPGALALFDLPFPYDGSEEGFGGTAAEFVAASQRRRAGGRINSFFDHLLPLYGAEAEMAGSTGHILIFDGILSPTDAYSGHPGYDFSVAGEARRRSTAVLAAAAGELMKAEWHDLMGWHVMLRHDVPEVGAFQTIYMHLQEDGFFSRMRERVGEAVAAGERIGTMGTTGNSDGEHLHFEVRFDRNGDGRFAYGQETVDPYGFLPSSEYPASPWLERQGMGAPRYLWKVPLVSVARVAEDGSGDLPAPSGLGGAGGPDRAATRAARDAGEAEARGGGLCAPPDSLPPGGQVQLGWAPDPAPSEDLAGVGGSVVVSVLDAQGQPVARLEPPLAVEIPFDTAQLEDVDPESLAIHRWQPVDSSGWRGVPAGRPRGLAQEESLAAPGGRWVPLPTRVDRARGLAVAATDRPGRLALLGRPTRDLVAPTTRITLEGARGAGGRFYDEVTVSLSAEDPSGIEALRYRLGFDEDWREYEGPFTLRHADLPDAVPAGVDARFMRGAGRQLVVASAIDGAGNVEEPPASLSVVIDRRADPEYTPAPPTATVVLTGTARAAATGTAEGVASGTAGATEEASPEPEPGGALGDGEGTPASGEGSGDGSGAGVTTPEADPARTATEPPVGARSGDASRAGRLAPGVATAAARAAPRMPTLPVEGPVSPTPTSTATPRPPAVGTTTAEGPPRQRAARRTATADRRPVATTTAAPRRGTSTQPVPLDPPGPGATTPRVPTLVPTPLPLPAPVLRAPSDQAEPDCGVPLTLDWDGVAAGGHRWELQRSVVGDDRLPSWQPLDGGETVGALSSTTLASPPCGRRLRWRVRGVGPGGRLGKWSSWRTFRPRAVATPVPPTVEPGGGYPYP